MLVGGEGEEEGRGRGERREAGGRKERGRDGGASRQALHAITCAAPVAYMQLLAPRLLPTCNYSRASRGRKKEQTALHAITCSAPVAYMQLLAPRLLPTCNYLLPLFARGLLKMHVFRRHQKTDGGPDKKKPYMQLLAPRLLPTCNYLRRACCLHAITCWFCLPGQPGAAEGRANGLTCNYLLRGCCLHAVTCAAAVAHMQLLAPSASRHVLFLYICSREAS